MPKFERRKESKNSKKIERKKKVKRRVRIVNNIDNIVNNTMIGFVGEKVFKCILNNQEPF